MTPHSALRTLRLVAALFALEATAVFAATQTSFFGIPVGGTGSDSSASSSSDEPAVNWPKKAVEEFPALMDGKSELNHRFIAKIRELKANNSGYFNNPQWPYLLAQEVNNSLSQAGDVPVIPGMDAAMGEKSPSPAGKGSALQNANRVDPIVGFWKEGKSILVEIRADGSAKYDKYATGYWKKLEAGRYEFNWTGGNVNIFELSTDKSVINTVLIRGVGPKKNKLVRAK